MYPSNDNEISFAFDRMAEAFCKGDLRLLYRDQA